MQLNSDLNRRVLILPEQYQFVSSPLQGVSRMMLDRAGAEVARATSIVRYAPGSGYSTHTPFTLEQGALIYVKVGHMGAGLLGDQFIEAIATT